MKPTTVQSGTIAEMVVVAELTKRLYPVCLPITHGSAYDLAVENRKGKMLRIQVKRAYLHCREPNRKLYIDIRRLVTTRTSGSKVIAKNYKSDSFDFAIGVDVKNNDFWIVSFDDFTSYKSAICLESDKGMKFKNRWDLL